MNLLVLDAGNTRLTACRFTAPSQWPGHPVPSAPLVAAGHCATPAAGTGSADLEAWLGGLARPAPEGIVLVSVVPRVTAVVQAVLPQTQVVDHRGELPFATDVDELAEVGPDRLCNMAAAWAAGLRDALVVDAGTATTFDILQGGVFRGGIIAPGMVLAAGALAERAARLARVPFAEAPLAAAGGTAAAMAAGAWHAGLGGVRAIVTGLRAHHGDLPLLVTGGLGGHLTELGPYDPDWTLRGAAWLALRPDGNSV